MYWPYTENSCCCGSELRLYVRVKVTSHGQVHGSLLPNPCVGPSDEHRLPVQGDCGVTHSSGCIFPVSHTQRHADEQQLHFYFPRTGAGCFHLKDWTHGRPGLIIHLEVRSESYEQRAEAPRSQSLPPLNARMFNPIPRRAS